MRITAAEKYAEGDRPLCCGRPMYWNALNNNAGGQWICPVRLAKQQAKYHRGKGYVTLRRRTLMKERAVIIERLEALRAAQ